MPFLKHYYRGVGEQIQFSSFTQLCLTHCNPKDCSMPGFPVHHHLGTCSTHVHQVGDALQPSHPLSSPSPPAFNLSGNRIFSNQSVLGKENRLVVQNSFV